MIGRVLEISLLNTTHITFCPKGNWLKLQGSFTSSLSPSATATGHPGLYINSHYTAARVK